MSTATITSPKASKEAKATQTRKLSRAANVFDLLSDVTRLKVMILLLDGERNVGEISTAVGQTQPACSHHLCLLRLSGLIVPRRSGKHNIYSLTTLGREMAEVAVSVIA